MPAALHIKSITTVTSDLFPPACFYILGLSLNLWGEQQLPKSCRGAFRGIGDLDTVRLQLLCSHARANHTAVFPAHSSSLGWLSSICFNEVRWTLVGNGSAKEKPSTLKDQKCSKHMKNLLCDESQSLPEAKQMTGKRSNKVTLSIFF